MLLISILVAGVFCRLSNFQIDLEVSYLEFVLATDEGYIVTGKTKISNFSCFSKELWVGDYEREGSYDRSALFLLFDSSGEFVWGKDISTPGFDLDGTYVIQTSDNGYIFVGEISELISSNSFLMKLTSSFTVEWYMIPNDYASYRWISETDEGYVLSHGHHYFSKLNFDGSINSTMEYFGGGQLEPTGFTTTSDGGYAVATGTSSFSMMKMTKNGSSEWYAYIDETDVEGKSFSVVETSDGGYVAVGYTHTSIATSSRDIAVVKFDEVGEVEFAKIMGNENYNTGRAIVRTRDDNLVFVAGINEDEYGIGGEYSNVAVAKISPTTGEFIWKKVYNSVFPDGSLVTEDRIYSLSEDPVDGGLILLNWGGYYQPQIIKISEDGTPCEDDEYNDWGEWNPVVQDWDVTSTFFDVSYGEAIELDLLPETLTLNDVSSSFEWERVCDVGSGTGDSSGVGSKFLYLYTSLFVVFVLTLLF